MKEFQFKQGTVVFDIHADSLTNAVTKANASAHLVDDCISPPGAFQRISIAPELFTPEQCVCVIDLATGEQLDPTSIEVCGANL